MTRYGVTVKRTEESYLEVEAEDEESAKAEALSRNADEMDLASTGTSDVEATDVEELPEEEDEEEEV